MTGTDILALAACGLVAMGLYGLVAQAEVLRKIIAFNLLGAGVFLLFGVVARRGAAAGLAADPVPQAMVITGLVVAFAATALMAVVVSFVLAAMVQSTVLAALLSLIVAAALAAGMGYVFGGATAQALTDLNNVILRFIKWDMEGVVPHAARADEVGEIAKSLKAFQADAIRWSESHKSEQDSQIQGAACLAAAHRGTDPSVPRLDRRHSRRFCRERPADGRNCARSVDLGERH